MVRRLSHKETVMEQCPCEVCIVLGMCRTRCQENPSKFYINSPNDCHLFYEYVAKNTNNNIINLDYERSVEAGKHLGYTITKNGSKISIKSENPSN